MNAWPWQGDAYATRMAGRGLLIVALIAIDWGAYHLWRPLSLRYWAFRLRNAHRMPK